MKTARQALGQWGEKLAARYLTDRGYTLVEANVRTPYGEIDLIARQGNVFVFVEVKTRTSTRFGYPEEAITPRKTAHLLAAIEHYVQEHPDEVDEWRVDVIAIEVPREGRKPRITHFENAIS